MTISETPSCASIIFLQASKKCSWKRVPQALAKKSKVCVRQVGVYFAAYRSFFFFFLWWNTYSTQNKLKSIHQLVIALWVVNKTFKSPKLLCWLPMHSFLSHLNLWFLHYKCGHVISFNTLNASKTRIFFFQLCLVFILENCSWGTSSKSSDDQSVYDRSVELYLDLNCSLYHRRDKVSQHYVARDPWKVQPSLKHIWCSAIYVLF